MRGIKNSKNKVDEAIRLCRLALNQHPINLQTRYNIYKDIKFYSRVAENYSQALVAMDSMITIQESIHNLQSARYYQANKVKFEVLNYETQLIEGEQRIALQKKSIIGLVAGSTLIIILLAWSLRLNRIRNKQRRDLLSGQEKILNLELENEKANNLLPEKQLKENEIKLVIEQEQYNNEIETKNRKKRYRKLSDN